MKEVIVDQDYSWMEIGVKAYYTNTVKEPVLCYLAEEDPEDRNYRFIYKGDKVGRMLKSKLFKTSKEAKL